VAEESNGNSNFGRTWTNRSVHNTHEAAVAVKEQLESDELQVKIRRTAEDKFRVKTRTTSTAAPKAVKEKDSGALKSKSSRRKEKAARHKARQENG